MQATPALGNNPSAGPVLGSEDMSQLEHDTKSTPKYVSMPEYKIMPLPVTKPMEWALTTPPNPFRFTESCVTKAVQSAVIGGSMGVVLGFLIGSYSSIAPPVTLPGVPDPPKIPLRYQMRESWMTTARQCRSMGKNFGSVSSVFYFFIHVCGCAGVQMLL
jgi:hypothetical protein